MFFPEKTETIKSPRSKTEVANLIDAAINPPEDEEGEQRKKWFNGSCKEDAFTISLYLKRPNNYLPVMSGILEADDDGGTIILIKYCLFPASKKLLAFWTVATLLITIFFAVPYGAYSYAAISFAACLMNYIITYENFKLQIKRSRSTLERVVR